MDPDAMSGMGKGGKGGDMQEEEEEEINTDSFTEDY